MSNIKEIVKEKYGQAALRVRTAAEAPVAGGAASGLAATRSPRIYTMPRRQQIPEEALLASLGCGNPDGSRAVEPRRNGARSGFGRRHRRAALGAARRAPGKAYGLDMTDEMLALANENKRKAGVENVEFLKGEIENIPLPDNSVDVIISNCVINLSADKDRVCGGVSRAQTGRPLGCLGRGDARRNPARDSAKRAAVGGMHGGSDGRERISRQAGRGRL